jgi:hypothetical protein
MSQVPYTADEMANPWEAARARSLAMPAGYKPEDPMSNPRTAHPDNSFAHGAGRLLRSGLQSGPGRLMQSAAALPFNHGALAGGAAGGLAGGAMGYGLARLLNTFSENEDEDRPVWGGALGALGGAGIGALLGAMREKPAALLGAMSDDKDYVRWRVLNDRGTSQHEKQSLLQAIGQLDSSDIGELANVLRTAIGAGVGVLVAKFLMKAGVGGMLMGALTGGFVGARLGGPSILGTERHSAKTDAYGNPYTF